MNLRLLALLCAAATSTRTFAAEFVSSHQDLCRPAIHEALTSADSGCRIEACEVLVAVGRKGDADPEALLTLAQQAQTDSPELCLAAIEAFATIGPNDLPPEKCAVTLRDVICQAWDKHPEIAAAGIGAHGKLDDLSLLDTIKALQAAGHSSVLPQINEQLMLATAGVDPRSGAVLAQQFQDESRWAETIDE